MTGAVEHIAVYRREDGGIVWVSDMTTIEADRQIVDLAHMGLAWVRVADRIDSADWYISDGEVVPRPALAGFDRLTIAAGGDDVARLAVDRPFRITIDGEATDVTEPTDAGLYVMDLGAVVPAEYHVTVDCWPYLPYSAVVLAQ